MTETPLLSDDEPTELTIDEPSAAPVRLAADDTSTPLPGGTVTDTGRDPVQLRAHELRLWVQEMVRAALAFSFVLLLGGVIVFGYLKIDSKSWANAKEYLDVLVPALSALLGSATGFYFASRR